MRSIKAIFPEGVTALTVNGLHQWDYGRKLKIKASDLSTVVEVHFACPGMDEAVVRACTVVNGVVEAVIPDRCLEQTAPVTAWVFEINGSTGVTTKTVTLPVTPRAKPQPGSTIPEELTNRYTELVTDVNKVISDLKEGAIKAGYAEMAKTAENALNLVGGEKIISGDLNDYKSAGNYYIEGVVDAPNIKNLPIPTAGVVKVISGNGAEFDDDASWYCIIQMFIAHSTGDMYVRGMIHNNNTGDNWRPWERVAFLGQTLDKGISPTEASLVFKNTNGFGTGESAEKGLWRVWNYGNDTDGYYCFLVPSIDNKQSLGTHNFRIKEAYIERVHGTADYAQYASEGSKATIETRLSILESIVLPSVPEM